MRGCRAITPIEFERLIQVLQSKYHAPVAKRNKAMFTLMLCTGLRIGECCKLQISDVMQYNTIADTIFLQRQHSKTKIQGESISLCPEAKAALAEWLSYSGAYLQDGKAWLFPPARGSNTEKPLFDWHKSVNDKSIRKVLDSLKKACFITGRVSTHSLRKTFAKTMYSALEKDLLATQRALRHTAITSTLAYLQVNEDKVSKAVASSFSHFSKR